jgi:hypothetical protein
LIRRWIWVVSAAAEFCLDRDQLFFDEEKQESKSSTIGGFGGVKSSTTNVGDSPPEKQRKSQTHNPQHQRHSNPYLWLGAARNAGTLCPRPRWPLLNTFLPRTHSPPGDTLGNPRFCSEKQRHDARIGQNVDSMSSIRRSQAEAELLIKF